jgi:dipeptidyl aminopeptidase/acylaminoacyl peptidase
MEPKIRKIIFLFFFALFFSVAPLLVLYFQGYRIDFENKKITQTGGLFLKTIPKQTEVYLDEKLSDKTDFFFGAVLIEELLPKKYNVKVEKNGYFTWEKNLEIREKEVTEAKNIVLFPQELKFNFLNKGIEEIWFSPDAKKMAWKEKKDDSWELKLYNIDKNIKSHLFKKTDLSEKNIDSFDLFFSGQEEKIYIEAVIEGKLKNFLLEIDREPPILREMEKPLPNKEDSALDKFLSSENIVFYQKANEDIYYLDKQGYCHKTDSNLLKNEKLTETPLPVNQEAEYKLHFFSDLIFLQEGEKKLYLLNLEEKSFEPFFEGIKSLKLSPDLKKLAYFSDSEIWVLFLEEEQSQPGREKRENIFLARFSEKIKDAFWITSNYIILNTENGIKIIENDNRDKINIIDLAGFENPEMLWSYTDKKIYILIKDTLWVSDQLIP